MTCCVAALCDDRKSIVLVSDKMVGMGIIESEPEISKILKLHKDWRVMIAGNDIAPAFPIVESAERKLAKYRRPLTVEDVERAICESYCEERARIAEAIHLTPSGRSIRKLNSPAAEIIPEATRGQLWDKLHTQRLDVSLLIAGFDRSRKGYIFSVDDWDARASAKRHDIPGFHSIGSGSEGAMYMMMYRSASASMPLRLMLYYALEGKYFGEQASGVGSRTDLYILRSGKAAFKLKEKVLENKLFKLCAKLEPRDLAQKHVDILNGLGGTRMDEIPKLNRKRVDGEFIIE